MNAKKALAFFLSLLVSLCLFAGYTHVSFSLSSAISVGEDVRYRFLGETEWTYVNDKSSVSFCIDPDVDTRIVISTSTEDGDWKDLCIASIRPLSEGSSYASAKWMWSEFPSSASGARWSVTGGKWNYIPLSERSVNYDGIESGKLTLFKIQATEDGENWEDVAVHGIIPVKYDVESLSDEKCELCIEKIEIPEPVSVEEPQVVTVIENVKEEETLPPTEAIEENAATQESVKKEKKNSPFSFIFYGGYSEKKWSEVLESNVDIGFQLMFNNSVGLDFSFSMTPEGFAGTIPKEMGFSAGLVYRDSYTTFFSPFVLASFKERMISTGDSWAFYPSVKVGVGIDLWFGNYFGLYGGFEGSLTFSKISEDPIKEISGNYVVGGRIRFGM